METIKTSLKHTISRYDKRSLLNAIPLILLPFTFFLFGPIEMVVRNMASLWFTWLDILPILLICFAVCLVVLFFIGLILPKKIRRYFIALFWGLGFTTYVQGNVLQVDYGIMDGSPILWDEFAQWAIINTIIWCVLCIGSLLAVRFWHESSQKIMTYVTCVIMVIQVGTSVVLILQAPPGRDVQLILTDEHLFTVSDNKNIVVLVLDSFDTAFMHGLLEKEPELIDLLDGFTFFDNTLGMFPTTKGAMPHILTGMPNLNTMPFTEYLDVAFSSVSLYPLLHERSFNTFIHTMPLLISPLVTNYIGNAHAVEWIISDAVGLSSDLFRFAGMRYFPHLLKERVWINISNFDYYRISTEHSAEFRMNNVPFHNNLVQGGLSIIPNTNVFSLIHLLGVHTSVEADDIVNFERQGEVTLQDKARGALQIALDFLSQLKEVGVADNTLFIVMTDHGVNHLNQQTLLLVRDPAHRAPFSISSVPISYQDIVPMLEAYVMGEETALSYLNRASLGNNTRKFFHYVWDDSWGGRYLPTIREYVFTDGSADFANAQLTGVVHERVAFETTKYLLGDTIHFAQSHEKFNDPQRLFREGLSLPEDTHTWSQGYYSVFSAILDRAIVSDLNLHMTFNIFLDKQTIRLYIGDQFVDERHFHQTGYWQNAEFYIPKNAVYNNNILEFRLEFPDASVPVLHDRNSTDARILAIALKEMTISELLPPTYYLGSTIYFAHTHDEFGEPQRYFLSGLSHSEENHTWSSDQSSIFSVKLNEPATSDLRLDLTFGIFFDSQRIRLYAGNQFIDEKMFEQTDEWITNTIFTIPQSAVDAYDTLVLRFEFPDAARPIDVVEENMDTRTLAIAFMEMAISQTE